MSSRVFQRESESVGQRVTFAGYVLGQDAHGAARAVLTIRTGAAETTLYPSADTLDALAENLREVASAVRATREEKAA